MGFYWSYDVDFKLEDKFGVSFETDDIVNFSSYEVGKEILNKLGVN